MQGSIASRVRIIDTRGKDVRAGNAGFVDGANTSYLIFPVFLPPPSPGSSWAMRMAERDRAAISTVISTSTLDTLSLGSDRPGEEACSRKNVK